MRALHEPLSLESIELDPPSRGEVLIRMTATGLCGSDLHVLHGHFPSAIPAVCGHEGAGIVEAVGDGVEGIEVGDQVVHMFVGPCGRCDACRRGRRTYCTTRAHADGSYGDGTFRMHGKDGADIATTLGLGSFSAYTVSPAVNCTVVPRELDPLSAALISCGVSTGVGAVLNIARLQPGDSVAVIGVGGVGGAAILGAVLGGASRIVGIDILESKRAIAADLGATDFVLASEQDPRVELARITHHRGVDRVLLTADTVRPEMYALALESAAPGGVVVQVGASTMGLDHIPVSPTVFVKQVSLTGTAYGGMDPARDARRYADLVLSGRLPIEQLVTRTYTLDEINEAFDDLAHGRNIRGVIRFA
jgi:S-(hydroxymethyl)glutathione dehydrogenase/alcohol dehydrogenase